MSSSDLIGKILTALEGATWEVCPSIEVDGTGLLEALSMRDYDLYREVASRSEARLLYQACRPEPDSQEAVALRAEILERFHPRDWAAQPPTPEEMKAAATSKRSYKAGDVFRPSSSHYYH